MTLKELIEEASREATEMMKTQKKVPPNFVGVLPSGRKIRIDEKMLDNLPGLDFGDPDHKEMLGHAVKAIFRAMGIVQYLYFCEVWAVEETNPGKLVGKGRVVPSKDPRRYEAIMFIAESPEEQIIGHQSIIRPAGKDPWLDDDLRMDWGQFTGRFCGIWKEDPDKSSADSMKDLLKKAGVEVEE